MRPECFGCMESEGIHLKGEVRLEGKQREYLDDQKGICFAIDVAG